MVTQLGSDANGIADAVGDMSKRTSGVDPANRLAGETIRLVRMRRVVEELRQLWIGNIGSLSQDGQAPGVACDDMQDILFVLLDPPNAAIDRSIAPADSKRQSILERAKQPKNRRR